MRITRRGFRKYASRVIGLVLFAWILARSDLAAIAEQIRSVHVSLYLAAFLLFLPQLWLKAMRWRRLVTKQGGAAMLAVGAAGVNADTAFSSVFFFTRRRH